MNNQGIVSIFGIMFAITIIILILALAPPLKTFNDIARNATSDTTLGLDCSNSSISDFDQAACVGSDLINPLFIGIVIGLAGIIMIARLVFGG